MLLPPIMLLPPCMLLPPIMLLPPCMVLPPALTCDASAPACNDRARSLKQFFFCFIGLNWRLGFIFRHSPNAAIFCGPAKFLKQFFFCFIKATDLPLGFICWHWTNAGLSAAKTGVTVMSVNANKHKMNAQVVILSFCNISSLLLYQPCLFVFKTILK